MYKHNRVGIVVPAYNENGLIIKTLKGIPKFVDSIVVIDDNSSDDTLEEIEMCKNDDKRIISIPNKTNKGLGYNLIKGYEFYINEKIADIIIVMAGDNQMDPNDLPTILDKLIDQNYDYVKGNRLFHNEISAMPKYRFLGNSILTILTKFSCGYYFIMDPQCGYTGIKLKPLSTIPIKTMTKRYGYNADILTMLNVYNFKVADVEVRPVYENEKSKIKLFKYIVNITGLLSKLFFYRMFNKYIVRDFHPLVLMILFGLFSLFFISLPLFCRIIYLYTVLDYLPQTSLLLFALFYLSGIQSLFFGLSLDMNYSRR